MSYLILQINFTTPGYTHDGTQGNQQPSVSGPVHLAANCGLLDIGFSAGRSKILSTLSTAPVPPAQVHAAVPTKPKVVAGDIRKIV